MFKNSVLLIGSISALQLSSTYRPLEGTNPWHKDNDGIMKDALELPYPINYKVPNFGDDEDIGRVQRLLASGDGDKWKFIPKKDRPKHYPVDYPVPDFGVDHDIVGTQSSIKVTEGRLKKKFNPVQDDNGVWLVPGAF